MRVNAPYVLLYEYTVYHSKTYSITKLTFFLIIKVTITVKRLNDQLIQHLIETFKTR